MQAFVLSFVAQYGYLALAALFFLENVFPPIPSEAILPAAGFMSSIGSLWLPSAVLAATIGSLLGAYVLYGVGRVLSQERLERVMGTACDPASLTDEQASSVMAENGLPDGANAEVALCMLMCATDSAASGDRNLATTLTVRARDLVGAPAVKALLELIRSTDAETGGADHADA